MIHFYMSVVLLTCKCALVQVLVKYFLINKELKKTFTLL